MELAIAFSSDRSSLDIVCLHVYRAFEGYQGSRVTYERLAETMRQSVDMAYGEFIKHLDFKGCSVTPLFLLSSNPLRGITDTIQSEQTDLVIVGARGRTAAAAIVLGSTTERLIASTEIPLVAVKKKGTGLSLLNALFPI